MNASPTRYPLPVSSSSASSRSSAATTSRAPRPPPRRRRPGSAAGRRRSRTRRRPPCAARLSRSGPGSIPLASSSIRSRSVRSSCQASSRICGPSSLVEEVLELERPATLGRLLRVERRLGPALLERRDDRGRVADVAAVEAQDREGLRRPAGEPERDRDVRAGERRAALVLDPLVGERPAGLLAVVRDRDVPEQRLVVAHLRSTSISESRRETRVGKRQRPVAAGRSAAPSGGSGSASPPASTWSAHMCAARAQPPTTSAV